MKRRHFVKSLGLTAAGMSVLRPTIARADATPRLILFFTPNGTIMDAFTPAGTGANFTLGRILAPLEAWKRKLLVVSGVDQRTAGPGDGHQMGMGHLLTARDLLPGVGGARAGWASGISIDQRIADVIGLASPFRSAELGVLTGSGNANVHNRMSYRSAGMPLPPENNPLAAYNRLFANARFGETTTMQPRANPEEAAARANERSVLDAVTRDFARIRNRVSTEDRMRMDAHADQIRTMEARLAEAAPPPVTTTTSSCRALSLPAAFNVNDIEQFERIIDLQIEVLAGAMTCNLTRVASLQCTTSTGNIPFRNLGIAERHHDLSHAGDTDAGAKEKLIRINTHYAEKFAALLRKLDSIPEGDGQTMLDNSVVIWVNELSKGNIHRRTDLPLVIAGGGAGRLRTGQHLTVDRSHNDFWLSILRVFGIQDGTFGTPTLCTGPIQEMLR